MTDDDRWESARFLHVPLHRLVPEEPMNCIEMYESLSSVAGLDSKARSRERHGEITSDKTEREN